MSSEGTVRVCYSAALRFIPRLRFEAKSSDSLDLDSVAAIIFTSDRRYLLQHREDRNDILYPNWWGLFGGAREGGEDAEAALRREIMKELQLAVGGCTSFLGCTYDLGFEGRRTRKIFFTLASRPKHTLRFGNDYEMTEPESRGLVLPLHNSQRAT